ncbi:2-oxoacid:acceptor oxidoreductase family protein [Micromonospora yasonensis]|uniref:2-oxoacid:acceptor oxidoreductase family protein n=1 Tax=Micromonospora yasonensis TaxID=1128667 RepID=UPI0022301BBE|nr:2-oxoacid:acceptor oxidoreductase family protein [Micromonospora yasonensis]MCW3843359.1 2-oxoacid:acceptor oxidoreductase family protein [Micromonospora yasonensis]
MERELVVTGVGGQGIQLLAKTLALAATREGRHAMLSADYGGEMRGGPSKASVVIGDRPLRALPVLASAWSAIVAHHRFSEPALARLRPGGPAILNLPLVDPASLPAMTVYGVDAAAVAKSVEAPQAIGFVLLGAYNAVTRLVDPASLVAAMQELLPPYRRQHAAANARALAAGAAALDVPGADLTEVSR